MTGASGFIGRHLVKRLESEGTRVVPLSRATGFDLLADELRLEEGDHVFHLAGRTGVAESWQAAEDFYAVNFLGTVRVLQQCARRGVGLSYASAYVYGQPARLPISETDAARPDSPYGHSKLLAEEACRFFHRHFGVSCAVLRLFNVYGPAQGPRFVIPRVLSQLRDARKDAIEVGNLNSRRDFVFVSDVVDAFLLTAAPAGFALYNIGSGVSHSVQEVIGMAFDLLGMKKEVVAAAGTRASDIDDVVADIRAIRQACGWRPSVGMREGLKRLLEDTGSG